MYQYKSESVKRFNVVGAVCQIAGAAFRFEACGHRDIWIYLKDCELQFHCVEFKLLSKYFVAHYPCHKVTHGFSDFEWNKLERRLCRVFLESN